MRTWHLQLELLADPLAACEAVMDLDSDSIATLIIAHPQLARELPDRLDSSQLLQVLLAHPQMTKQLRTAKLCSQDILRLLLAHPGCLPDVDPRRLYGKDIMALLFRYPDWGSVLPVYRLDCDDLVILLSGNPSHIAYVTEDQLRRLEAHHVMSILHRQPSLADKLPIELLSAEHVYWLCENNPGLLSILYKDKEI